MQEPLRNSQNTFPHLAKAFTYVLSILLPVYKCSCVALVTELQRQCMECGIAYEIIVADDGTMADTMNQYIVERNKVIGQLEGVRYIIRQENVGRSAIRNFLFSQSKGDRLLFIDGDLSLDNPDFIRRYTQIEGDVVVGGIKIGGKPEQWKGNLRYKYECAFERKNSLSYRQNRPFQSFRTTNFMVKRAVFVQHPFDEKITHYGYEDVLWGKALEENGVQITHINNPITLTDYENNTLFIDKTEESLRTLYEYQMLLKGYSKLLEMKDRMVRFHLVKAILIVHKLFGEKVKMLLQGNKPSVFLFNVYKLMYYISLEQQAR